MQRIQIHVQIYLIVNYGFAGTLAETESIGIKIVDPGPETDHGPWTMDGGL